ncbi:MAG: hypothetical protein K6G75_12015 [Lachnospiraceae bacterium]|nr:hypothetical protein [Lachnospiraceae bacterium]
MIDSVKRNFTRILTLVFSVSFITLSGCNNQIIDSSDYPTPVNEGNINEGNDSGGDKTTEDDNLPLYAEALKPEPNSIKENGRYVYNPVDIPREYLNQYKDKPKIIKVAKDYLYAIDNVSTEFEVDLPEEEMLTEEEFTQAMIIASMSNPIASAVDMIPIDDNTYELKYFPSYYIDPESYNSEFGGFSFESRDDISTDEAGKYFENFTSYVTDTINKCLSPEDSEIEMASKLYKQIIKDMELEIAEPTMIDDASVRDASEPAFLSGSVIRSVSERKFVGENDFCTFYIFLLNQVHIEAIDIMAYNGVFNDKGKEIVSKRSAEEMFWEWVIISADGKYYHCDPVLEKLAYDKLYADVRGVDPDMDYFGMSDTKRCETFKFSRTSLSIYNDPAAFMGPGNGSQAPECEENYSF